MSSTANESPSNKKTKRLVAISHSTKNKYQLAAIKLYFRNKHKSSKKPKPELSKRQHRTVKLTLKRAKKTAKGLIANELLVAEELLARKIPGDIIQRLFPELDMSSIEIPF